MKKLLLIPLQLLLLTPNIYMMQINHNFSNNISANQNIEIVNYQEVKDNQVMFNWENNENNESSYGYYTQENIIKEGGGAWNKNNKQIFFDYEWKIGITNKTSTYYTSKPFKANDVYGQYTDDFAEEFNFNRSIEELKNYYGIGFELKITNAQKNSSQYEYLEDHDLYISQTYDKNDKIGNYQKAIAKRPEVYEENYYFYYDNWSGMMQDDVYLNFLLVDKSDPTTIKNINTYNSEEVYQKTITKEQINAKTGLEKDNVNTYNNAFGINYDDVEYHYYENQTHSSKVSEDWKSNDYTANFNVKWNAQTLFWKEYFYDWSNNLYFSAIYEIPVQLGDKKIDVVGFTNNGKAQVGRNYVYDENVDIKPEKNLEVNLELYSDPVPTDPINSYSWRTYPFILGYYEEKRGRKREFIPITDKNNEDSNLFYLNSDKISNEDLKNYYEGEPNEIHFILSNEGKNDDKEILKHSNLFETNEEEMNETILHSLVNTNNENIYEFPNKEDAFGNQTNATGYQNAFLIPEWDNINHPKTKGSFYYVNLVWLVISLFVGFVLLILILIPVASKRKKELKGRDKI